MNLQAFEESDQNLKTQLQLRAQKSKEHKQPEIYLQQDGIKQGKSIREQEKCCRICFQEVNESSVSFCSCKGSNRWVHQVCLLEWVKKCQRFRESWLTFYVYCDVCRQKMYLETQIEIECLDCERIAFELFGVEICCTIVTTIFLSTSLLVLILIAISLQGVDDTATRAIYIIAILICAIIFTGTLFIYVIYYVLDVRQIVVGIRRSQKKKRKAQIEPSDG